MTKEQDINSAGAASNKALQAHLQPPVMPGDIYLNGALVQKSTSYAGKNKNLKIIICVGGKEENRHLLMCNKES